MKVREYTIMLEAVERGVRHGISRYNKHRDIPVADDLALVEDLVINVMHEISEYFIWEDISDEA